MSKKKNKGNKPEQKNIKKNEEIKDSEIVEKEEEISEAEDTEDTAEENEPEEVEQEAVEESEEEVSEEEVSEKGSGSSKEKKNDSKADKKDVDEPKNKKTQEKNSERDEFLKLSFADKCKKDPVIPVMLILAFVAVVVAAAYFILPIAQTPSLGFTLDDFKKRYNDGEVSYDLYSSGVDIRINYTQYVDHSANPSILGDKETFKVEGSNLDYFNGDIALMLSAGLEGASRRNDGEVVYIRTYVKYEFEPTWMIFANTLAALYPDLTRFQALDLALNELNDYKGDGLYAVRGDIAFRVIPVKVVEYGEEANYVVIEAVPKSAIAASQIGHVVDVAASTAESSAASEATTAASVAET